MPRNQSKMSLRYRKIYETLRNEILSGVYKPGQQFPTEHDIMARFDASRTTVRTALKLLQEESLIVSKQGSGTTVTSLSDINSSAEHSRYTEIEDIDFCFTSPPPWEESASAPVIQKTLAVQTVARELEIPVGTEVYHIQWLLSVNGKPYNYLTHYMRTDFVPDLEKKLPQQMTSVYRFVEREYGLHFTEAKEDLLPICASFIESRFLNVPTGTPLLKLCRSARCQKGPLEYCETILNPDILKVSLTLGSRLSY